MPELPEVETVRRTLLPHVVGQRIVAVTVRQARLRFGVPVAALAELVRDRVVGGVRRRGKYLLFDLLADPPGAPATVMLVHLGMSGRLGIAGVGLAPRLHDHVLWTLDGGRQLRLNDARRFGMVDAFGAGDEAGHARLRHLGPEPLDATAFCGAGLHRASRAVQQPIKSFLMDAQRVVGVGNIYACEALHQAGIHPLRAAGALSRGRCDRLVAAVRDTLRRAIEDGGTTLRDFSDVDGTSGLFVVRLRAYGREGLPCGGCGRGILRRVQAGRSTFYCGRCQH